MLLSNKLFKLQQQLTTKKDNECEQRPYQASSHQEIYSYSHIFLVPHQHVFTDLSHEWAVKFSLKRWILISIHVEHGSKLIAIIIWLQKFFFLKLFIISDHLSFRNSILLSIFNVIITHSLSLERKHKYSCINILREWSYDTSHNRYYKKGLTEENLCIIVYERKESCWNNIYFNALAFHSCLKAKRIKKTEIGGDFCEIH